MTTKQGVVCLFLIAGLVGCNVNAQAANSLSLKDAFKGKFLFGTALNDNQIAGGDSSAIRIAKQHFNSIVAENCMKSSIIHPKENQFDFSQSDQFVNFGVKNGFAVIGHCLIWHSQLADWFCVDERGNNVSPEVLKRRMKHHIQTLVGRYKGKIHGWDVVNEAILDNGDWRKSKFYEILGEEFIFLAFEYAQKADPRAELYYNDYNMSHPGKRKRVVELVRKIKAKGLRIDAVGMQGHMGMDYPGFHEFETSILDFASTGVKVMITEWDMSVLRAERQSANIADREELTASSNPYTKGLPEEVSATWNKRMIDYANLFVKHSRVISRVTVWGVSDKDSWKNDHPVNGRTDYPLLFDRNYQPKPFVNHFVEQLEKSKSNQSK